MKHRFNLWYDADTDYVKIVISDDYYNEEDDRAMRQSKFII